MPSVMYDIKVPSIQRRIENVTHLFSKFLEFSHTTELAKEFLHNNELSTTNQILMITLANAVKSALANSMVGVKNAGERLTTMKNLVGNEGEYLKQQSLRSKFEDAEVKGLTQIAKLVIENFVHAAKPETKSAYVSYGVRQRYRLQCVISPSSRLTGSELSADTRKSIAEIINLYISNETVQKVVYLCKFCNDIVPSEGRDIEEIKNTLLTYVDRWNAGDFPVKICNYEIVYQEIAGVLDLNYHISDDLKTVHRDRRPEHYILDGQLTYSYEIFCGQIKIDLWRLTWEMPEVWITPANCHIICGREMQVVNVTDLITPEEKDVVVLQFRRGDNQPVYDSELVFYRRNKEDYEVLGPSDPEVINAAKRIALLKQLMK